MCMPIRVRYDSVKGLIQEEHSVGGFDLDSIGAGSGTPSPLFFGGGLTVLGNKMRTNGVSNDTTFSGFDAGSEHPMPQSGTLTRVMISRTNTTSDVTFESM